jgi:hypothetical protein
MMQPYGVQQGMGMMQSAGAQQRKMQPIGAGRGGIQQQGGVQQGGAVRGNGYQQGGVVQQDFAKISANNNNSIDWEALGMFRR